MRITPKLAFPKSLLFSTLILFALLKSYSQDFHYIEFTTKDGLAGNTVYDMCQDRDGFLWFATEAGVSRYDGNSFTNYTTKDGLPDNEVLKIYGDSHGRVWMSPFKNELCFFKNGKIYNRNNSELLRKLKLISFVVGFAEDNQGNLVMNDLKNIYFLSVTDSLKKLPVTGGAVIRKNYYKPGFRIVNNDSVFDFDCRTVTFKKKEDNFYPTSISVGINEDDENQVFHPFPGMINLTYSGTQVRYVSTVDGCYRVNRSKDGLDRIYHFLPGKKVLKAIEDEEGFLWISVPGEGVYKLTSTQIANLATLNSRKIGEIHTLVRYNNTIVAGCDDGVLHFIEPDLKSGYSKDYYSLRLKAFRPSDIMRAYCSKLLSDGSCLVGFDGFLLKLYKGGETVKYIHPAKSIVELPGDRFVLATALQVVRGRTSDLKITDTITNERATSVLSVGKELYIGTLSGLNLIKDNSRIEFLGKENSLLKSKISDLKEDNSGIVWVGTNNTGLIGLKDNKVVYHITEENGLSSNIIQCLAIDSNVLWAGTNKGINKVSFKKGLPDIAVYSYTNGIASDMVTALMVDDKRVYAGTSAGLSVFDKHLEIQAAAPRLRLLNIVAGDKEVDWNKSFEVGYRERIKIDFAAISYSDHAGVYYVYTLHGYSDKPDTTRLSHIEFTSLPGHSYVLELKAVSASGKSSPNISIPFKVNSPFWEKKWFIISVILVSIFIGWSILFLWLKIRNRRRNRINFYEREIMELRQKAVLAKMNPHFIFNSLNTLQDYIINKDFIAVNRLLVGIASLIRQTLENSFRSTISIKEEIKYLSTYLEIEQMRFENKFQYDISTSTSDPDRMNNFEIPTLIIQPFVENAVKHGIGSLEKKEGCIKIRFCEENDRVWCSIIDNGIGIRAHREKMVLEPKGYISRGTFLVEELVKTIEISTGRKIKISVVDLAEQGIAHQQGTQVTISF